MLDIILGYRGEQRQTPLSLKEEMDLTERSSKTCTFCELSAPKVRSVVLGDVTQETLIWAQESLALK